MSFETFKRQRISPTTEPLVTIQRKGIFSLNRAAYEALGKPEAVELLYDRKSRLAGLRKVSRSAAHAYKVRPVGKSATSWIVSGIAFMNYYGISVPEPVRRTAQVDDGVLVIDLKDPGTTVPSSTGGRKAQ